MPYLYAGYLIGLKWTVPPQGNRNPSFSVTELNLMIVSASKISANPRERKEVKNVLCRIVQVGSFYFS